MTPQEKLNVIREKKTKYCSWHGSHDYWYLVQDGFGENARLVEICSVCMSDYRMKDMSIPESVVMLLCIQSGKITTEEALDEYYQRKFLAHS